MTRGLISHALALLLLLILILFLLLFLLLILLSLLLFFKRKSFTKSYLHEQRYYLHLKNIIILLYTKRI